MNWSRILIASAFVGVLAVIIVALMPIKLMLEHWGMPDGVIVSGPSGTLWDGRAEFRFQATDVPVVAVVAWQWCPSWSRGLLSVCFDVENEALSGHGFLFRTLFDGDMGLEETRLQIQFGKYAAQFLPLPVAVLGSGNVEVKNALFDWGSRFPVEMNATGRLVRMRVGEIDLGDYLWRVTTNAGMIETRGSGGGTAFQVKAQARLALASRRYQYEAELSSSNKRIQSMVAPFTKNTGHGVYMTSGQGVWSGEEKRQP